MASFLRKFVKSKSRSKSPTKLQQQPHVVPFSEFLNENIDGEIASNDWEKWEERASRNSQDVKFSTTSRSCRGMTTASKQASRAPLSLPHDYHYNYDNSLNNNKKINKGLASRGLRQPNNRPPIHYFTPDYKEILPVYDNYYDTDMTVCFFMFLLKDIKKSFLLYIIKLI